MNITSAIYVRNVAKHYGDTTILNGFSMTVERGTIYGLLGPSGCGKTTLLNCIVGRKSIDSGDIWVLGKQKGTEVPGVKVGYMPQELALVEEFTVRDAIYYFGTIFKMKSKDINDRFVDLTNLLELPPKDRFLKNCSGGQKRRVSLAAALVHTPELLVLDEPTVGVDPILREKIWDYLKDQVTKNKISVIITTHYIEETKEANKIGLMRGGKLLIEESPTKLLSTYQTDTLEEVFLLLSQKQESERNQSSNAAILEQNKNSLELISTTSSVESFAMEYSSQDELTKDSRKKNTGGKKQYMSAFKLDKHRMKALLDKNLKQFYRNIEVFLFLVTFPILQLWFYNNSIGVEPKNLNLGIVNNESFTALCNDSDWNQKTVLLDYECHFKNLSCRYLSYLENPMINKVLYESLPAAVEGVKHGETTGIVYIPGNFTATYEDRLRLGSDAKKWTTNFGEIKVYMDMSNKLTGATLGNKLLDLFIDFQKRLLAECELSDKLAVIPIRQHFMYGDDKQPAMIVFTPGVILMLLFLLGSTMTSNIIVKDKIDGVWDRSIIAGVSSLEITLAHLLLEGAIMFIQSMETLVMSFFILQFEYVGSLCSMFAFIYLQGLCGMAYGLFISSISNGFTQANILCTGGYLPLLLIGGVIWPIEAMPTVLRLGSLFLPCTIALLSFRNIMSKGWSIWHPQVINGVGVILIWIGIFAVASIWFIKIKN